MPETVLFIHSIGTSPTMWTSVPSNAIGGREAICPANLGYPPHDPLTRGAESTAADEAAHLFAVLADKPGAVHIVAHSYGATVALAMAEFPEWRNRLASMVLFEPVIFGSLAQDQDGEATAVDPEAVVSARVFANHPVLSDADKGGGAEWLEAFIDYWNRPGAWLRMPEAMKQQSLALGWKMYQEVRACFGADKPFRDYRLDVPTTLIMGARTTNHSRTMTHALARAHAKPVVELPGTWHMAPLTHPALVHAAIAEHFAKLTAAPTESIPLGIG